MTTQPANAFCMPVPIDVDLDVRHSTAPWAAHAGAHWQLGRGQRLTYLCPG